MSAGDANTRTCEHKLERKLTLLNVWSMAFGCVIGFGAFMMPGTVFLKRAGTVGTLIAIEIGAIVMLVISYSYSYMIQKFPVAGGEFVYATRAFGRKHGFLCAWFLGLSYLCLVPVNANAIAVLFRMLFNNFFQFKFLYTIAGDDIYLGEIILALFAMIIFAMINMLNIKVSGILQTIFVILLISGVVILVSAAVLSPVSKASNFKPLFYPDKVYNSKFVFLQILSVSAIAPWAFVGFETVPKFSEESSFSMSKVKVLMDTCIILGVFVYVSMNLFAASYFPENYANWAEYIDDLGNLRGIISVPVLYVAHKVMGVPGLIVAGISALCAMLTGIVGFYSATSRLLYSMSENQMLPEWFGRLNKYNVPMNATLFCLLVSLGVPFAGRVVLGWAVDMSSIGAAISFGYTALATRKYAALENKKDIMIFAAFGFLFSVLFAIILLIPIPFFPGISLSFESYMCLVFWILLGIIFYRNAYK